MLRKPSRAAQAFTQIDKRIWVMLFAVGVFGWLVMKEVALPKPILLAAAGLAGMAVLFMGLESPEVPFYTLIAYLPFSRMLVGDFGTQAFAFNLTNMLMFWAFMAHVIRQTARGRPVFEGTPFSRVVWLFVGLSAFSLILAGWEYGSWYVAEKIVNLKRWETPMLLYFLTLWSVRDRRVLKTTVVIIMFAVFVAAGMAIRDYMWVGGSASLEKSRVGGIAEQPNMLGAFFCYYMFLFPGVMLAFPNKLRSWLLMVPFLMSFRGIMVTFSRGAYLGFASGLLTFTWFRKKALFFVLILLAVFAFSNPWMLPGGLRYRMGQTVTNDNIIIQDDVEELSKSLESSAASRVEIWMGAIQMIREHPWWGVGYGSFPHFIGMYIPNKRLAGFDAHNSYLLIAAEMGIPTLLVFIIIVFMAMYYTRWLYKNTEDALLKGIAAGFLGGLGGLLVVNIFGSRMDAHYVSGYFWVLCGLVMRGVLLERRGDEDEQPRGPETVSEARKKRVRTVSF